MEKIWSGFSPGSVTLVLQQMCPESQVAQKCAEEPAGGASLCSHALFVACVAEHVAEHVAQQSNLVMSQKDTPQHPQQA